MLKDLMKIWAPWRDKWKRKTSRNEEHIIWNKHLLDRIKNRLETSEEKISEPEDITINSI